MILIVLLAVAGLAAGLLGGLLGIGGSIVMIPCMRELLQGQAHGSQHLYQAAAMIVNFFVVCPAVYQHVRARAIIWPVVTWLAPTACVCVLGGVMLSELPVFRHAGEVYLAGVFGLFLFYVAAVNFRRLFGSGRALASERWEPRGAVRAGPIVVGMAVGLVAGLLGVGGGIVSVPLQQRLLRMPLRNAIANSAVTIIPLSVIGACLKNQQLVAHHGFHLRESLFLAAILIPTAIAGGFVGGRLTHSLPLRAIRAAFAALMLVAAFRMLLKAAATIG